MKKFVYKQLPEVSREEHKERYGKTGYNRYKMAYTTSRILGKTKKESRSIAATFDVAGTIKSKLKEDQDEKGN